LKKLNYVKFCQQKTGTPTKHLWKIVITYRQGKLRDCFFRRRRRLRRRRRGSKKRVAFGGGLTPGGWPWKSGLRVKCGSMLERKGETTGTTPGLRMVLELRQRGKMWDDVGEKGGDEGQWTVQTAYKRFTQMRNGPSMWWWSRTVRCKQGWDGRARVHCPTEIRMEVSESRLLVSNERSQWHKRCTTWTRVHKFDGNRLRVHGSVSYTHLTRTINRHYSLGE
jgi:hypothetical protein